jgi:hypothetical protein
MTQPRFKSEDDSDFSKWDEMIFERCLQEGFNVFGSRPTPVFLQPENETRSTWSSRAPQTIIHAKEGLINDVI